MPEGDTLHRIAQNLAPTLEGQTVLALELPRSEQRTEHLVGRRITRVEARGKNLLIFFDEGSVLHTHLRMNGIWHLYRAGEPWRRSPSTTVVALAVAGYLAVCFRAPVVRLLRARDLAGDPTLGHIGPDLLGQEFDADEALRRLRALDDEPLGVAVMDQQAIAGIGNVYKSELLFLTRLDPFAPVRAFSDEELTHLIDLSRRVMQANVAPPKEEKEGEGAAGGAGGPGQHYLYTRTTRDLEGVGETRRRRRTLLEALGQRGEPRSVYRRADSPCLDCGTSIVMRRQGEAQRSTYFCPRCQPPRGAPPG
jgi:endonuclease-8